METAANTSKALAQHTVQQTASNLNSAAHALDNNAASRVDAKGAAENTVGNNPSNPSAANSAATVSEPSLKYGKPPTAFTSLEIGKLPKAWSITKGDPLKLLEEIDKKAVLLEVSVIYDKKWSLGSDSKAKADIQITSQSTAAATASHVAVDLKIEKDLQHQLLRSLCMEAMLHQQRQVLNN